jgi:hypothetical protein
MAKLPWFKFDTDFFNDPDIINLFTITTRRDQHKIIVLSIVIMSCVIAQSDNGAIKVDCEIQLSTLQRLSRMHVTNILNLLQNGYIIGVTLLQVSNKSVTIRHDKLLKLYDIFVQDKEYIKKNTNTSDSDSPHICGEYQTATQSVGKRGIQLTSNQKKIKFDRITKKWKNDNTPSVLPDLQALFPDIKNIQIEVIKITDRLISLSDEEFDKNAPYGFSYLVNCLKNSKSRKAEI